MSCFHHLVSFSTFLFAFQGVSSNPGTEFLITFPQAQDNPKHTGAVLVTMDKTNPVDGDIEVSLLMKDPDEEMSDTLTQKNPMAEFNMYGSRIFPYGNVKGQKYLIRLVATGLVTVVVRNGGQSNIDSYLAIPVNQLGVTYFPLSVSISRPFNAASLIVIAADSKSANVKVRLPLDYISRIQMVYNNVTYQNNDVIELLLQPYEAYQFQFVLTDITGAYIESDEAIAVWSRANRTSYKTSSRSHVLEQIPPLTMTGHTFVIFPLSDMSGKDSFLVVNIHLETEVTIYSSGLGATIYTMSRPGSVLEIEFDPHTDLTYVDTTRPAIVYMANLKNDSHIGDPMMTWLPPLDVRMPSCYWISTDWRDSYTMFVFFAIETSALPRLTIDGQLLSTLGGVFTFKLYNVLGQSRLSAGRLRTSDLLKATHELCQEDGVGFVAVYSVVTHNEGEGHPLSYGLEFAQQNYSRDDDKCCVTVNAQGTALHTNECSDSVLPYMAECCLVDFKMHSCKAKSTSNSCDLSTTSSKRASVNEIVPAHSMLECHMSCLKANQCLDVNFDAAGPASTSCELLSGLPLGYDDNPSGPWRHVSCTATIQYILED